MAKDRTPCQIFTRVMGYLAPVSRYNIGKKSEFYGRKYFEENKVDNSEFLRKFLDSNNTEWQKKS